MIDEVTEVHSGPPGIVHNGAFVSQPGPFGCTLHRTCTCTSNPNALSLARRCCSELEARFASDAKAELSVIYRRTPETRHIVALRAAIDDHYARTLCSDY